MKYWFGLSSLNGKSFSVKAIFARCCKTTISDSRLRETVTVSIKLEVFSYNIFRMANHHLRPNIFQGHTTLKVVTNILVVLLH